MAFLDRTGLERLWLHIVTKLGGKVDKEDGKGLSTNDYTTDEKDKLASIETITNERIDEIFNGLSTEIVPTLPEGDISNKYLTSDSSGNLVCENKIIIDESLSNSSINPIQNKVVNSAIENRVKKTGDTMAGELKASSSAQDYSTMLIRNSKLVSTETIPTNNGEICWLYE